MLQRLSIRNLALIESLDLGLEQGFTCLTGETGAGKSILLDAMGLLLGSRGSAELIRTGEDKAYVEGLFNISEQIHLQVAQFMDQVGIEFADELVISREINASGKSVARVNGRMMTLQLLRDLGKILVQQHGQHDTLTILKKDEQLRVLDLFDAANTTPILTRYQTIYYEYQDLSRKITETEQLRREQMQRLDFLRMQVAEIGVAKLKIGEEKTLRRKKARLLHAERLKTLADSVYQYLYEGTGKIPAVNGELFRLRREVEGVLDLDGELAELQEYLETAQVQLSEAAEFARNYRDKMNYNPEELEKIEERLAVIDKLLRKYGENEQDVLSYLDVITVEIQQLEHMDEHLEERILQQQTLYEELRQFASALSEARRLAAGTFETNMQLILKRLHMPNLRLEVRFVAVPFYEFGSDEIEFYFSANQGEELRPLAKIASGGELSRFMLALSKVLAGSAPVDTMIFDEIDTGISGAVAQKVAETIMDIAHFHQVLCVTHQAQMACLADVHLLVEKTTRQQRTVTSVRILKAEERVEVLAGMLGGETVTDTTRQHARELLSRKGIRVGS